MKALLFDACDVLYHRPRFEQDLDGFFGPDRRRIRQRKAAAFAALQAGGAVGKISVRQMFDAMLDLYGLAPGRRDEGRRFLADAMADIEFFEGVCSTLHRLKADAMKLGIVTNSPQRAQTKLSWFAKAGIDAVWDVFICSSETGLLKPQPEIFLAALDHLHCAPAQAGFVGHAADELDAAKALGLTTISFNRNHPSMRADHHLARFSELVGLVRRHQVAS